MARERPASFDFFGDDWRAGTKGMPRALKGLYIDILVELYDTKLGALRDDDQHMVELFGGNIRGWRTARDELVDRGKIEIVHGFITNGKVVLEKHSRDWGPDPDQVWAKFVESLGKVSPKFGQSLGKVSSNIPDGTLKTKAKTPPLPSLPIPYTESTNVDSAPAKVSVDVEDEIKKVVWNVGVPYLDPFVGGPGRARMMIGKWLKGHPHTEVLEALRRAERERTQDPIPYVTAILDNRPRDGPKTFTQMEQEDRAAALRESRAMAQELNGGRTSIHSDGGDKPAITARLRSALEPGKATE